MTPAAITGLILCGGKGRRMGGVDKGLVMFRGKPLAAHVIERLRPQVGALLINANQHAERYAAFGYPVIADEPGEGVEAFAGPLAGILAGLRASQTAYLATAPCDAPFLPLDLVARLAQAMAENDARLAIARDAEQAHPVFLLCHCSIAPRLADYLARGGRKMQPWYAAEAAVEVLFPQATAFANLNTPEELARLEK